MIKNGVSAVAMLGIVFSLEGPAGAMEGQTPDEGQQKSITKKHESSRTGTPEFRERLLEEYDADVSEFKDLTFEDVVSCFRKRKMLKVNGEEYIVRKELPKLRSKLYNGKKVQTNPCYPDICGLGPRLLKKTEVDNLPEGANFFFHSVKQDQGGKYFTVRFTSNDNPHWGLMHTFPEPFKDPENRYWEDEHGPDCVRIERTVNFLLQKVDVED
ncbi:MAG: hypothetical protein BGO67_05985 [Alphaproteobacteria bacterium 41-28]|nr:MAG: hypothetical protein BGO67_05985 [Alphaproteobacteria bacterium 41-28]